MKSQTMKRERDEDIKSQEREIIILRISVPAIQQRKFPASNSPKKKRDYIASLVKTELNP